MPPPTLNSEEPVKVNQLTIKLMSGTLQGSSYCEGARCEVREKACESNCQWIV